MHGNSGNCHSGNLTPAKLLMDRKTARPKKDRNVQLAEETTTESST